MEFDFLKPIDSDFLEKLSSQQLGSKIVFHTKDQFPDLNKINIAVIGVLENRGSDTAFSEVDIMAIRKELYNMFPGNWDASIADLGDILSNHLLNFFQSQFSSIYILTQFNFNFSFCNNRTTPTCFFN